MKKSMSALFIVAALALTTSACGGDDGGDRPTKAQVKKAITGENSVLGTIPDEAADCVAGALVDSKVSNKALDAIVDGDKDFKGTDKDQDALSDLTTKVGTCVTE